MRRLPHPEVTGVNALNLCASSLRDLDLRERLLQAKARVEKAEIEYFEHGKAANLHSIKETKGVGRYLSGKEMERLYNGTFVRSSKTRDAYGAIKKACKNDICPLCGQGTVRQLDHYLPITSYPVYGLTAINLIPACSDCNKNKLAYMASTAGEQTIHPYFDNVEEEQWLFAEVAEGAPPALIFEVKAPASWDHVQSQRMQTHFRIFRLGALYSTHAAVEINNMRHALQKMSTSRNSVRLIRQHLRERAESCAQVFENSWQRATFDALADSEWFCSGGFNAT